MRAEYDFAKMKGRRNPYASRLKKPVTMRLGSDVVEYFKKNCSSVQTPLKELLKTAYSYTLFEPLKSKDPHRVMEVFCLTSSNGVDGGTKFEPV